MHSPLAIVGGVRGPNGAMAAPILIMDVCLPTKPFESPNHVVLGYWQFSSCEMNGSCPLAWCNNGAAVVINRHWAGSIKLSRRRAT